MPAFAEEAIIEDGLKKLAGAITADQKRTKLTEVIIVVADGGDNTAKLAKKLAKDFAHFKLIEPGLKVGKGRDVRAGILAASGEYILFLDADMATPPAHIKRAFDVLESTGADLLIAQRTLIKIHNTLSRKIKSVVSNWLIRTLATPNIKDTQCGFKAFTKEAARKLFEPLETLGWGFDIEILVRAKTLDYKVEVLRINDWFDPKEDTMGLVGESSLNASINTLKELFKISYKRSTGYYKK